MDLFDLHCDTLTKLYDKNERLSSSTCQITRGTISSFYKYVQIFAVFSKPHLSDNECYRRFFDILSYINEEEFFPFVTSSDDLDRDNKIGVLSVEDARLLAGEISRLDKLIDAGVRVLTPLWKGETVIGGSFDTDKGLTDFGKEVVRRSFELGVILDVSHASGRSADEMIDISCEYSSPIIASHSNSFSVCHHPRNLTDERVRKIAQTGGIIGICLHSPHLSEKRASINDVISHIERLIDIGGERIICLGCDLDGTNELPKNIFSQSDLIKIAEAMVKNGYTDKTIANIFYNNAYDFFKKELGKKRKVK